MNPKCGDIVRRQRKLFDPAEQGGKRVKTTTRFTVKVAPNVQKLRESFQVYFAVNLPAEVNTGLPAQGDMESDESDGH